METFELEIYESKTCTKISWPVVKDTGKAVLVQTPGGEIWLPLWKFEAKKRFGLFELDGLVAQLDSVTKVEASAVVPVKKKGKGPTDLSGKYQVTVSRANFDEYGHPLTREITRTFTLPVSQIIEDNGKFFAPVWLFRKHLDKGESVVGVWPGLQAVKTQIEAVAAGLRAQNEKVKLAAEQMRQAHRDKDISRQQRIADSRQAKEDQRAAAEMAQLARAKNKAAESLAYCKKHFEIPELAEHIAKAEYWEVYPPIAEILQDSDFEAIALGMLSIMERRAKPRRPDRILEGVRVEWVDWVGPSSKKQKVENSANECRVKFFGKKREITLPSGEVIIKMAGQYLRIIEA